MEHLNQKCFSTQIWTFIVIVSWIDIHANGLVVICLSSISQNFGLEGL